MTHLVHEDKTTGELYAWTIYLNNSGPPMVANACLEATLLRVRVLAEFLTGRPSKRASGRRWSEKDIQPTDFVREWQPSGMNLDGYRDLVDKHVAHLSIERSDELAGRPWALTRMVDAVLTEFANFADAATRSDSRFAEQFRTALEQAWYYKDHEPVGWPPVAP